MNSTSKRLAGALRFLSSRPMRYLAAFLVIFQALGAMPVLATPVAISVNFGGNVAGFAGDTAILSADWGGTGQFINWNNYANGAALNQVNLTASSTAGPAMPSGVNMNVVMYNAAGTMGIVNNAGGSTGAVSADDQQLMNSGLLSQGPVASNATTTISFTNLNAFFLSGYKVYVYADAGTGNTLGGIFGSTSVTVPGAMTHTPGTLNPYGNNNAFNNDWAPGPAGNSSNHRARVTNGAGNIVNNTLTVTDYINVFQTGINGSMVVTGVQIVGDVVSNGTAAVSGNGNGITNGDITPSVADGTDFGTTGIGNPVSSIFRVDNSGPGALTTSNLTVPAGYSILEPLSASIPANSFDTFTVQLDALAVGTYTGIVSFNNNDPNEDPFTFTITGNVVPEPSAWALWMIGSAGMLGYLLVRKRRQDKS